MNLSRLISSALFSLVSVISFSVWAFGSSFFPSEPMMYAGCATVFLGLGGTALLPAIKFMGKEAVRFCIAFAISFLVYAVLWSVAWFSFSNTFGEITGSLIGLVGFGFLLKKWMGLSLDLLMGVAILFLFHTAGYYLGGFAYDSFQNRGPAGIELSWAPQTVRSIACLAWGGCYGLGLALGVIHFCHLSRQSSDKPSTQI